MASILRFFTILHTIGRYRLDRLLPSKRTPKALLPLLFLLKCYPKRPQSRGESLRKALEELGPVFVKFGQLLSTRPDLIPPDICIQLNYLQDQVAPFPPAIFEKILVDSLAQPIDTVFDEFSTQPLASASVAQVHTARLKTGEAVVIKIIRPNIHLVIAKDIALLRLFANLVEKFLSDGGRFKTKEVVADYQETILDELDLQREAANASILRRNFEHSNDLYIPQIYWDYSSKNVMVMERIDGIPITDIDALKKQNTNLKKLAERGVQIFFTQVFEHNFFHADMHPGNIFVSRKTPNNPTYMAVDMAIVGSLTKEDQYYLARNMLAMFRRDYRQIAELHVSSGWVPKTTSVAGFEAAIRSVCEPVFEKPLKEISFGKSLINLFQTAQRYNMPVQPQLVLLQKTLLNIEGLGRQLYPDLNLWETAHPFLESWMKKRFSMKRVINEIGYHGPEWIEKFPHVPQLLLDTLTQVKKSAEQTTSSMTTTKKPSTTSKKSRRGASLIAMITGTAIASSQFDYLNSPQLAVGLGLVISGAVIALW